MIASWIGSIDFALIVTLYIALAFGLPFGELAMSGRHKVLPRSLRLIAAVSVLVQIVAILVLLQLGHVASIGLRPVTVRGLGYFFTGYLVLNTLANLRSKSKREKLVMTPMSLLAAISFAIALFAG